MPYDAAGYTIREVDSTVPEGFDHVDDWTISADDLVDGTTKYYSVIDKTLNSRIQIVKTDAETGNTVPLSGFKFQVLDSNGETMSFADPYDVNGTVDTFTTDDAGRSRSRSASSPASTPSRRSPPWRPTPSTAMQSASRSPRTTRRPPP